MITLQFFRKSINQDFCGGDGALKRAGEMIQERFQNVSVNFYTGGNYPAPPPIVKQAGEECDVVIGATAD